MRIVNYYKDFKNIGDGRKRNWIGINIFHERYSFETEIRSFKNVTIEEVFNDINLYKNVNIKKIDEDRFLIDLSSHSELDIKYEFPQGIDKNKYEKIHLETIYIIAEDTFMKDKFSSFSWGFTNIKFGLIDKKIN